jgi:hypothetical protein
MNDCAVWVWARCASTASAQAPQGARLTATADAESWADDAHVLYRVSAFAAAGCGCVRVGTTQRAAVDELWPG